MVLARRRITEHSREWNRRNKGTCGSHENGTEGGTGGRWNRMGRVRQEVTDRNRRREWSRRE